MKSEAGSTQMDRIKLRIPMAGRHLAEVSGRGICAYVVDAAVRRIVAGAVAGNGGRIDAEPSDGAWHHLLRPAGVREGQGLAKSLEEAKVFPQMSVEMIEVGESTGALPAMLNSISEFYEEDVQNALATAMALIEPIILIVMGVVVAFVLISLYLPIFSLGAGGLK